MDNCNRRRVVSTLLLAFAANCVAEAQEIIVWNDFEIDEVTVVTTGVDRLKKSAFNVVGVDTRNLEVTNKSLADALKKTPGVKLRETGGVGSETNVSLDGFSGKHVKVFIDGVPQDGASGGFSINNIPAGYAERIEVYKGVVPVDFGADAIGGVVNVVTKKQPDAWHLDASYTYGSFNTHKSDVAFSQRTQKGFVYELHAFQNYSDNNYTVDAPIYDFEAQRIDMSKTQKVERFNDQFHNESLSAKAGWVHQSWADRLVLTLVCSNFYKEIQTGVRQKTVYGQKHRRGYSVMPSLEFNKRNMFVNGLTLTATASLNHSLTTNVDTASLKFNWLGESRPTKSPGEQSYQHSEAHNNNWHSTANLRYFFAQMHSFTLNNVFSSFSRSNTSLLYNKSAKDEFAKTTSKNIIGLSYRYMPSEEFNVSAFAKHYYLGVDGPIATDANASSYQKYSSTLTAVGYGMALSVVPVTDLQLKFSYEKPYRLPSIEEMFGDEDLESGSISIRPEWSHNFNAGLSYSKHLGNHYAYAEVGWVYRNTNDYIQRSIAQLSGGREGAFYQNYGKVKTVGLNASLRYNYGKLIDAGGSFTHMDITDNEAKMISTSVRNPLYGMRMPNVPYQFADFDFNINLHKLGGKTNCLTLTYDNHYLHSFSYCSEGVISVNKNEYVVPTQFSQNMTVSYSIKKGSYSLAIECRNFTDAKLYDNFSLQKAGRGFYGKVKVSLGKKFNNN